MGEVRCDLDALDLWAERLREFIASAREGLSRIQDCLREELPAVWNDRKFQETTELLAEWGVSVERTLDALDEGRSRASSLRVKLERYLEFGGSGAPSGGSTASSAPPSKPRATLRARDGRPLRLVGAAELKGRVIDWTSDDMRAAFYDGSHHGHCADDYRRLMAPLAEVLRVAAAGQDAAGVFAPGTQERLAYEIFLGSDPIRIEDQGGVLNVIDGRHRLFAAIESGVEVPVDWVDVPPPARATRGGSVPFSRQETRPHD